MLPPPASSWPQKVLPRSNRSKPGSTIPAAAGSIGLHVNPHFLLRRKGRSQLTLFAVLFPVHRWDDGLWGDAHRPFFFSSLDRPWGYLSASGLRHTLMLPPPASSWPQKELPQSNRSKPGSTIPAAAGSIGLHVNPHFLLRRKSRSQLTLFAVRSTVNRWDDGLWCCFSA